MTSVNRVGDRTSGRTEETIRIGLTEAQAETLAMVLTHVTGPNYTSRRAHTDEILNGLALVGVLTHTDASDPLDGVTKFPFDETYEWPLDLASEEVRYL
jgi:hypothetical protein